MRRLKQIEKIEFQSPESKTQDSKISPKDLLGILDLGFQRLKLNLFNLFQSPDLDSKITLKDLLRIWES